MPVLAGCGWMLNVQVAPAARLRPVPHWFAVIAKSLALTWMLLIVIAADPSLVTRIWRGVPTAPAATGSKSIFVGSEHTNPACAPAGGP